MLKEDLILRILDTALSLGADFAELFMEDTEKSVIDLSDCLVEDAVFTRKRGVGIRVALGPLQSYAYTADLSESALIDTASDAAAALTSGNYIKQEKAMLFSHHAIPVKRAFSSVENSEKVKVVLEACRAARAESAEITQVEGSYIDVTQRVWIANSYGTRASDVRPRTRVYVRSVASDGKNTQSGMTSPGFGRGFEAWSDVDLADIGKSSAKMAVTMLHAEECPAGYMPVIIDNGFGGVIFHEACGHSLEATSVARGGSEFAGKLGQKVASECVTAIDDGTLAGEWGSLSIDDEGELTRRNVLIENGILKSYLVDRINGRRMNALPTGSSRRQSYEFAPTSRMTNTFIDRGSDREDEMISTMGDGLYAKKMGGGSVDPMTGEFNFAVVEGYWIKNGSIYCPVRGATLIGRGTEVLTKIDRVGTGLTMGQGMCGSVSGSIPTNVGQPMIRVQGMTVGGRGGKL